ncbi:HK97 gp10 family phage protein [Paenibacillus sp. Root444D2]|uniref:HK97 gp10 family phage protein n=1 Tax=Paenibacillus sp. Root444D2 TaxID=1736538 RepID=UPI00070E0867|nr:HK97 gp10 family phage protein [Paenibacillus sp. Root444D2]KQX69232.1 hypothetical protein ASD40_01660 [Paenibacillus sp. Root444D2]
MADGFDFSEMEEFTRQLMDLAVQRMPRESKKFLRDEGNKLKKDTKAKAKQKVKKDKGIYQKSIKRGKVYKFNGNQLSIRTYSNAPHAHLIEHGHRIIGKDGSEHGFKQGEHVFEDSVREFHDKFISDVEDFVDEMLEQGLR